MPSQPKPKYMWKVYFWLFLVIKVVSFIYLLFQPQGARAWVLAIEAVIYPLVLCGVYGYAYNKRFFFKKLWPVVLVMGVLWDGYIVYELAKDVVSKGDVIYWMSSIIMVILVVVIPYFSLYFYSYRSEEVWVK